MSDLKIDAEWDDLDKAFNLLAAEMESTIRGLTVEVWNQILNRTPQYYGRAVVSYTYSLNGPIAVDRSYLVEPKNEDEFDATKPKSKGHMEAINLANFYNRDRDMAFRLGDVVYITNGADHGEGAYAQAIEDGQVMLRAANLPGQMVRRTLDSITARYSRNISPNRASLLRQMGISE